MRKRTFNKKVLKRGKFIRTANKTKLVNTGVRTTRGGIRL